MSWKVFHQWHDPLLRLISFPKGLGCSHWSPGFFHQSPIIWVGRFFTGFPFKFFHRVPIQGFYSRFPFKISIQGSYYSSTIPRLAELTSKKESNCNNVTLGVESSQSGSHVTTTKQNFILSGLTSITALGHLRHWVGGAWFRFIYTTE